MTELGDVLEEIGLSQYLETFIEHGFDTWETFADITEPDFDVLGVKLGHRRKIQRRIANARGVSAYQPLVSPTPNTPSDDRQSDESRSTITKGDVLKENSANASTGKRKYRRHPKPDENAPERPPSAYVIFSNKMRDDLKGRHLSFTEIAKLVGEHWQSLSPAEKEPFEAQAFNAKEKYNAEMVEYKKTDSYKNYSTYLLEFKEKHPTQQQATEAAKRPRLINENSGGSSSVETIASQQESDRSIGHGRVGSVGSVGVGVPWFSGGHPSPSQQPNLPNLNVAQGPPTPVRSHGSPGTSSSEFLPGYREAIFGSNQQTLAWRDHTRETESSQQLPRIMNMGDRRQGQMLSRPANLESQYQYGPVQPLNRTSGSLTSPPPLLSSESTSGTTLSSTSSTSNASSHFYPRTPIERTISDRSLPIPQIYAGKPPQLYETQLPPLRSASSISPKNTSAYNSPASVQAPVEFPTYSARGYAVSAQQHFVALSSGVDQIHTSASLVDEEALDPVSALLRADEIVSRNTPRQ